VKGIHLGVGDETNGVLLINVVIQVDLESAQASFGSYELDLDDRIQFEKLTQNLGLRGQLDVQSLVSGQLYVSLDIQSGREGFQLNREQETDLWEIPTIPSTKQKLMQSLVTSLENLTQFDVKGTSEKLQGLLDDLRGDLKALKLEQTGPDLNATVAELKRLVSNPELHTAITNLNITLNQMNELSGKLNGRIDPILTAAEASLSKAGTTIDEAAETLRQVQAQLGPNSTLGLELVRTLEEASLTLNSLRQLAQEIQRNPSSLITGKKETTP
jgi:paraquat-inducible protein B